MKFSQWIGVAAIVALIISSFLHWAWYPDIQKYFTGYFSENNDYGQPGKAFIVLGAISIIFFAVPKLWAKRWNIFVCAITLSWAIRCFIVFSGCYRGICPEKQFGLWLMLSSAIIAMAASLFPDTAISPKDSTE